jgi:LysM repeat protein
VPHPLAHTAAWPAVAVADSASVKPASERQPTRITVRSGDSLYRILGRYPGLTIEELYRANKGSDRIYPGQILIVP